MTPAEWLVYANQGATRSQPLAPELVEAMKFLPELGLQMQVFSGGQPGIGTSSARVGSTRHDHGKAADVFFLKDGQRLDWANPQHVPIYQDVVRRAKAAGVTGFGAGPGYMQPGSMHIGFGAPSVWGAGGKAENAPEWLRMAFGGAPAGPAPNGGQPSLSFGPSVPSAPSSFATMFAPPGAFQVGTPMADPLAAQMQQRAASTQQAQQDERDAQEKRRVALLSSIGSMFG